MTDERANYTVESMKQDVQEKLRPDAAPLCDKPSIDGHGRIVAGPRCGMEKGHLGPCSPCTPNAAPPKEVERCREIESFERCCIKPIGHDGYHDYHARTPEVDAPEGPWEVLARELYAGYKLYLNGCYFCDYKSGSGHADDCRWDVLDRLDAQRTET